MLAWEQGSESLLIGILSLGSLVGLGIGVAILRQRRSSYTSPEIAPFDALLQKQMSQVGIADWATLTRQSGLTRQDLDQVRLGRLESIPLGKLIQIAQVLGWNLDQILSQFKLSNAIQEIAALRHAGLRLQESMDCQRQELKAAFRQETFTQLQPLLTSYPSVRQMASAKPDLPARNVVSLFTVLDNLLAEWEIQQIGGVWQPVAYDPQLHQPDVADINPGEVVYVRFVGYRSGETILCPAKVSRALPVGALPTHN